MSVGSRHITVYEHERLRFDLTLEQDKFLYEALERFYGNGTPFFRLIHHGVQFTEYVGVLQVGRYTIEVLPKADRAGHTEPEEKHWRGMLIDMMRAVRGFQIDASETSSLKIKPNSVLDLYFDLFVSEAEYLLHTGLVKQYRHKEGNTTALKGSLQFAQHIRQNLVHQERFYVRHTVYDEHHRLHAILYKTLRLIQLINSNSELHSRIGALLLYFPEMSDLRVTEATFEKIVFNRKTQRYQKALAIARLLLLNYHPDVQCGRNDVLALMFDMNRLWEQFLYVTLCGLSVEGVTVHAQPPKKFWQPDRGRHSRLEPDIWIRHAAGNIVLDTKWKNLNGKNPSPEDLRQMYVYHDYFGAKMVALVYPGGSDVEIEGAFWSKDGEELTGKICSVLLIPVPTGTSNKKWIRNWQDGIRDKFIPWIIENIKQ